MDDRLQRRWGILSIAADEFLAKEVANPTPVQKELTVLAVDTDFINQQGFVPLPTYDQPQQAGFTDPAYSSVQCSADLSAQHLQQCPDGQDFQEGV